MTIGAGLGTTAVMKNMKTSDYYMGVDIDFRCAKNADALAKKFNIKGLGIAASLWNLPFEDNVFSTVCSNAGIEECREIETILSEAYRVLKHDGRLVLHLLHSNKSAWCKYFADYGFSEEETFYWLEKCGLYANDTQIEQILQKLNMKMIKKRSYNSLGHILVFEK